MTGSVVSLPAWKALSEHHKKTGHTHLREMFAVDAQRGGRYALEAAGLYLDYSKNRIDDTTLKLLAGLAHECGLAERIQAMFRGDAINTTEKRSVLHIALRAPATERILVDGIDVVVEVHAVLERMVSFADSVRSGQWLGHAGALLAVAQVARDLDVGIDAQPDLDRAARRGLVERRSIRLPR